MAYPRSVSDYLNLVENGNPVKPTAPQPRYGTMQFTLTENSEDECGPIEIDVHYLVHYRRVGTMAILVMLFAQNAESGNWRRVRHPSNWTQERLLRLVRKRVKEFHAPSRLEQAL